MPLLTTCSQDTVAASSKLGLRPIPKTPRASRRGGRRRNELELAMPGISKESTPVRLDLTSLPRIFRSVRDDRGAPPHPETSVGPPAEVLPHRMAWSWSK
jgi:hypothetical protein